MPVNIDKLKAKYKEVERRSEAGPFMALKSGDNLIRVLPPVGKMGGDFYKEGGIHFNVGSEGGTVICPKMTSDNPCPICESVDKMLRSGKQDEVKIAKQMKGKPRFWINVINRSDASRGVQVLGLGIKAFKDLLGYFTDPDFGDLTDMTEGRDVLIEKTGQGLDTDYKVRPRPKTSKLTDKEIKSASDLTKLDLLKPPSADEISAMLDGTDSSDDEEDEKDEDETEENEKEKDEDDDEEDYDEEEDDEEDEKDEEDDDSDDEDDDDDDEDEEEEDDDEEEEKPSRKSRSSKKEKQSKKSKKNRK